MALINTEEGAKRLARVILSDIELYSRERPRPGETLAAQLEEGRRLFKSRVVPDVLPLFDVVLADRQNTRGKTTMAVDAIPSSPRPIAVDGLGDDQPTPGPVLVAQVLEPRPSNVHASTPVHVYLEQPMGGPVIQSRAVETPVPLPMPMRSRTATPLHEPIAGPARERLPERHREGTPVAGVVRRSPSAAHVPLEPFPSLSAPMLAVPPSVAPYLPAVSAPELAVPVLTARISYPRLLLKVAVAASAIALLYRFVWHG